MTKMKKAVATTQVILVIMCVFAENGKSFLRGGREVIYNKHGRQIPHWDGYSNVNKVMRHPSQLPSKKGTAFGPPLSAMKGISAAPPLQGWRCILAAPPPPGLRSNIPTHLASKRFKTGKV